MSRPAHKPRTYAQALEDLGGQPWRSLDHTEQWFLVEEEDEEATREPNTASFHIPRPSNRMWLLGGGLCAVGLIALLLVV